MILRSRFRKVCIMIEECGARGMTAVRHNGAILDTPDRNKFRGKDDEGKLKRGNNRNYEKERRESTFTLGSHIYVGRADKLSEQEFL